MHTEETGHVDAFWNRIKIDKLKVTKIFFNVAKYQLNKDLHPLINDCLKYDLTS